MLTWNEQLATGSQLIDTQHRMLFVKVNYLESLLEGPPQPRVVYDELVNFLGSYAVTHFQFEEECMRQHQCPVHAQNKAAHASFLATFEKLRHRYLEVGPDPGLLRELQSFISTWIRDHILAVDVNLRVCLRR